MEAIPLPTQIDYRLPESADPIDPPSGTRPRPAGRPSSPTPRPPIVRLNWPWYLPCKTALDTVLAVLMGVLALPLIGLSALAVRLTSRGPAFYSQMRVGRHGRLFRIWKIRTMIHNCESLTGPRWSMPGDPRVTPVGWLLRRTHLDELPQLLNVLRGEMSLVGPRPERPEFVPDLERAIPAYGQRLRVKPGVTGLAQVQLPPDTDLSSVRRKLASDLYYVMHVNPWLDLRLLVSTAFYALGVPFARFGYLLGLPNTATVQWQMEAVVSQAPAVATRPRLAA
jgi:lipopolysaccharide/colanic/teichoic acid biosynthesis glycosyltransferase